MDAARTWALLALVVFASGAFGQHGPPGIAGARAPRWEVTQWINLPDGKKTLDVGDFEGRVLYLYGFQSWCPGCHARGFPTLKRLIGDYEEADDVAFVAVQTVFEGFGTNTAGRAWETARRYELDIPVGHDGTAGRTSVLMRSYRTGGTPWTVIIDKQGIVRWNGFHLSAARARRLIDGLRADPGPPPGTIETLPKARGGQDLLHTRFPKLALDRWLPSDDERANRPKPKATLYRWWTDTCPYCEASLPAVETLRREYEAKGLRVVAIYHPKPPRRVEEEEVLAAARRLGYGGQIAVDEDWSALKAAYLDSGRRGATSVTFLVDDRGIVRFVHPGPVYFPSTEPGKAGENRDYERLKRAVEVLLGEARGQGSGVRGQGSLDPDVSPSG